MSRLALYLLGPPRIERDGVPIQVDTRKAIALLIYLAVTGEGQRRASLVNLLWPEYDRSRGRAALRRTLYALSKALAGTWLEVDRGEIGLNPSADIWVDVNQFRQHLAGCERHGHPAAQVCRSCVIPLTDAVALTRGEFLSGFGLRDSINFDDWQFFQADALSRELTRALDRLVLWHSAQREFERAMGYARRRLALDPLDEQAHCHLMQLHAWLGQRSAALSQYEECTSLLEDQLGVPPQAETTELCNEIKAGHAPPLPAVHPHEAADEMVKDSILLATAKFPQPSVQPPSFLKKEEWVEPPVFVAREGELTRLASFLDAMLAGQGKVAFVTGEAGSGKTALIQEFVRQAQEANPELIVAWGHGNAHTGTGDPYLPFREVLGLLTGDVEDRWAAGAMTGEQARRLWNLLPQTVQALVEVGPDLINLFVAGAPLIRRVRSFTPWPPGIVLLSELEKLQAHGAAAPNLQQSALLEQYCQVLQTLARQSPLLLALDDLQWADAGSINLLFHLGRQIQGNRIMVLGAYRPDEIALGWLASPVLAGPTPGEPDGPTEGARTRHPLEPIVNEFKRAYGDIEVDLHQAEGRRFVDAFLDSEPNQLSDAFRSTLHQHTAGVPLFTVELLHGMQERGDLVPDKEGRWVEGPALDWETLPVRVEAVIAERIDRLPERSREILAAASVEGETFTAEVAARVARTDVPETIRSLSDTLDRKHRLVSARSALQSGDQRLSRYRFRHILFQKQLYNSLDPVKKAHLHHAVGVALETLFAERAEEAEAIAPQLARHFQKAGTIEKAVGYLSQAGTRAQRLYANTEAVEHFRRALELLEGATLDSTRRSWQEEMTARMHESLGDVLEWTGEHDSAQAAFREALTHVPADDLIWQSHLQRKVGNVCRMQSQHERALEAYDLADLALEEGALTSTTEWWQEWVQVQLERMWTYYWQGQWGEISRLANQVRSAVEQRGTPSQCISFFLCLASMNNRRDRYLVSEETLSYCQTALAISLESENPSEIAWARFMLGFSQLWFGDLTAAEKQMQAALALADETGDIVHQSRCLTYLTILSRRQGQIDQARHFASRCLLAAKAGHMIEYLGTAQANLAWLAWREGQLSQAEKNGQAALELWQQLPAGHSSCAFQWTALWPLMGVALAHNRTSEAHGYARALLDVTQQSLPSELALAIEKAVRACEGSEGSSARAWFDQAMALAQELGYV